MDRIIYYILVLPLSYSPFFFLYGFSNFLYLIVYRLIGYRKKVVRSNLKRSFPDKTEEEILSIEKKFYKHLCDLAVEGIKNFTISEEASKKRMKMVNPELFDKYFERSQSVVLVGGHYNNWELFALALPGQIKPTPLALYTPLKNKFWDNKVTESRSKYGLHMLQLQPILDKLNSPDSNSYAIIFGNDQAPRSSQLVHYTDFLNQDTAVHYGAERMARDYDLPVIFGTINKLKRGRYEVEYSLISDDHSKFQKGEITAAFTKKLEEDIQAAPEFWLWSHKRWKRKRSEHQSDRII